LPLIAVAFIAHAVGLLLGFGGVSFLGGLVALIAAVASAMRRDARFFALAVLLGAGVARATAAARADADCQRRGVSATPDSNVAVVYRGVVEEDVRPGKRARAFIRDGGCQLRASLVVTRGEAIAGASVAMRGEATRAGGLIVLQPATVVQLEPPGLARRWRERAGRAIDTTFRGDAPLARALLIADTRTLDAGIRSRYADAGIVHLLSVSGLHVAIIAGAAELLLSAARASRNMAAWLSLALTAAYVLVIGAPAPAVRAAVMLGAAALSRLTQRPTSPWAALALGAWGPLYEPRIIVDLGYQLSVVGIAALIAAGALSRRLLADRLSGWRRVVARDLIASSIASIVTLPLLAYTFGRVSLVAPLANLAAGPVFTVMQPTLFLALLLSPLPRVAAVLADAAHVMLLAVDAIAGIALAMPYAAVPVAPSFGSAVLLAALSVCLVVACCSRPGSAWESRAALAGAASVAFLALGVQLSSGGGVVELHVIDVGQGDAVALRTPRGRWVLFDAGRSWSGGDAGRNTIVPYLRRHGGELRAFVLSHPHSDHVGGGASVIGSMRPAEYWDAAYVAGSVPYRASLTEATRVGAAWRRVDPGDVFRIDGVHVRFLAPDSAWAATLDDANDASAVALVQYGAVRFLLTGDAETREEEWMVGRYATDLRADVLKVGHHGSPTSSTPEFLDAVRPRVAVVSVGAANSYGHPSPAVIRSLMSRGAQVLRTDHLGTIVVRTDGRALRVSAGGEQWYR
jgi:competence protein ComEC